MMRTYGNWVNVINSVRQHGWTKIARTWLSKQPVIFGLAGLVAALLIVANELNFGAASEASQGSVVVAQRQASIYDLQRLLLDAETGQRGYLLTGESSYLKPYTQAVSEVEASLNNLRTLVVPNGRLTSEFSALSRAISRKLAELELTVQLRQSGAEHEPWQTVTKTGLGRQYMDDVRAASDALLNSAARDLTLQTTKVQQSLQTSRLSVLISAIFCLLAFGLYLRGSTRLHEASQKRAQDLQQEKAKLEGLVALRTAELERLANHLINVQERERERLARELHDELGSLLTAAKFDVARVKSRLPTEPPDLHERLSHLTSTLNAGIAIKRKIIEDLRPSSLSNLGLPAALEILTQEFRANTQLSVDISVDDVELNEGQQLGVYRLVQEAFTNIAKHAHATRVQVLVKSYRNHIEVVVSDDGVGFDAGQSKNASHGLSGMRQRMHALQGRLELSSTPGQGTTIKAILPLGLQAAADVSPHLAV
jgi:signal transduction histidine kinase